LVKIKFREIDFFDFTIFFGLDFFKFSGPLWDIWMVISISQKKIFFREIENRQGARDIGGVCNENANFVVMTMKMMLHIQ